MTSFKELVALFPGENKEVVSIVAVDKLVIIEYIDGTDRVLEDPTQVQDITVPPGKGTEFMDAVRAFEPTATKSTYFSREFLENVRENLPTHSRQDTLTMDSLRKMSLVYVIQLLKRKVGGDAYIFDVLENLPVSKLEAMRDELCIEYTQVIKCRRS